MTSLPSIFLTIGQVFLVCTLYACLAYGILAYLASRQPVEGEAER